MTPSTDANLRRFVQNSTIIGTGNVPSTQSPSHPVGLGIKAGKNYAASRGTSRVPLPFDGDGLGRIQAAVGHLVPGLRPELSDEAWGCLLGRPGVVFESSAPSAEDLLNAGITPAVRNDYTLRRVVLGTVLRVEEKGTPAPGFVTPSVAGIAVLTVQMTKRGQPVVLDAWFEASWVSTTRALAEKLEGHVDMAAFGPDSPAQRVAILLDDTRAPLLSDEIELQVARVAAVAGFRISVFRHSHATHGYIANSLASNRPTSLIAIGNGSAIEAICEPFEAASGAGRIVRFDASTPQSLHEALRERVTELAGVAPSLSLLSTPPRGSVVASRPRMKITPVKCLHSGGAGGHTYVLDEKSGYWWTRDTAGHAHATFKRYRLEAAILVHDADLDVDGEVMGGKYKGEVGKLVPTAGMHSCAYPESHL